MDSEEYSIQNDNDGICLDINKRSIDVTLKITKVSKYIPEFDFEEEYKNL